MSNVIEVKHLSKSYRDASDTPIAVLKDIHFTVQAGEIVAIVGQSGSGKSTLLHAISGLDSWDKGEVVIAGASLGTLSDKERTTWRNEKLGFVYQFHHLLPEFTALENVAMPLIIARTPQSKAHALAREALKAVGLEDRLDHLPSQLSGGERQRTAIARAMVTHPACILADEPTGNLDHDTAERVFTLFVDFAKRMGSSIVIVTHDEAIARRCDRCLTLKQGTLLA